MILVGSVKGFLLSKLVSKTLLIKRSSQYRYRVLYNVKKTLEEKNKDMKDEYTT